LRAQEGQKDENVKRIPFLLYSERETEEIGGSFGV